MFKLKSNGFILKIITEFFKCELSEGENKILQRLCNEKNVSLEKYHDLESLILNKEISFSKNILICTELFTSAEILVNKIKSIYTMLLLSHNLDILKNIFCYSLAYYNDKLKIELINESYKTIIFNCEQLAISNLATFQRENIDASYLNDLKNELNEISFNFLKPAENLYKSINNFTKKKTSLDNILEIVNEIKKIKKLSLEKSLDIFLYLTLLSLQQHLYYNLLFDEKLYKFNEKYIREFDQNLKNSIKNIKIFKNLVSKCSKKVTEKRKKLIERAYKKPTLLQYQKDFYYATYLELIKNNKEALNKYMEIINVTAQYDYTFFKFSINKAFTLSRILNDKRDEKIFNIGSYYGITDGKFSDNMWFRQHYNSNTNFFQSSYTNTLPSCKDLRYPNAKYLFYGRERTRLEIYSFIDTEIFNLTEEEILNTIKKLLKHGADVNSINSTGDTPLILAISSFHWDRALLLLEQPEIKKTIDQCSIRRKNTALLVLINSFANNLNIDDIPKIRKVFYKILEYNPDLNLRVGMENGIYVRYLMFYLYENINPIPTFEDFRANIDALRRMNIFDVSITNDELLSLYLNNNPSIENILFENNRVLREKFSNQEFVEFIFELITALLDRGIDINVHYNNVSTIMYAAEIGNLRLFKLLEKYAYMYEHNFSDYGIYFNLYITALYFKNDIIISYIRYNYPSLATQEKIEKYIYFYVISNLHKSISYNEEDKIKYLLDGLTFLQYDYPHLITKENLKKYIT